MYRIINELKDELKDVRSYLSLKAYNLANTLDTKTNKMLLSLIDVELSSIPAFYFEYSVLHYKLGIPANISTFIPIYVVPLIVAEVVTYPISYGIITAEIKTAKYLLKKLIR